MNKNETKNETKKELLADAKAKFDAIKAEKLALMNDTEDALGRAYLDYEDRVAEINRIFKG